VLIEEWRGCMRDGDGAFCDEFGVQLPLLGWEWGAEDRYLKRLAAGGILGAFC